MKNLIFGHFHEFLLAFICFLPNIFLVKIFNNHVFLTKLPTIVVAASDSCDLGDVTLLLVKLRAIPGPKFDGQWIQIWGKYCF